MNTKPMTRCAPKPFAAATVALRCRLGLITLLSSFATIAVQAQWKEETFTLENGWNAIFLHVDAKYTDLDTLLNGTDISEVWLWVPAYTSRQFITSPERPTDQGSNWLSWNAGSTEPPTLQRLMGNAAYLVKFDGTGPWQFAVKGIPVAPHYAWSSTGENFLGLSTPAGAAPSFDNYLAENSSLASSLSIFEYNGGLLDVNPTEVLNQIDTPVTRGKAFWMKAPNFNNYFHPFDLTLPSSGGVEFGGTSAQATVRVRNRTQNPITVTIQLAQSETAPDPALFALGTPPVTPNALPGVGYDTPIAAEPPPVIVRGAFDPSTLNFPFTRLTNAAHEVTLNPEGDPGSVADVVLGIDIAALGGNAGDLFAGILRFTDSLGYASIDVPVRTVKATTEGLWVGEARIDQVQNAASVPGGPAFGPTSTAAPLRLILHHSNSGDSKLFQRIYFGYDGNFEPMLSTQQTLLDSEHLNVSRRISAVHLPWTEENDPIELVGSFGGEGQLTAQIETVFDDHRSNPFLHSYHPDHDNLDATFDVEQGPGQESYDILRDVTLTFDGGTATDFESSTQVGNVELRGGYEETITIVGKDSEQKAFSVRGSFTLKHLTVNTPLILGANQ